MPDTVQSGFGIVLAEWLAVRDPAWRGGIAFAALDPFDGNAALLTELPRRAADARPFHVVRLGFQAVDGVRRRA